jgi:predicted AAA+ superfamily ATPase
MILEAFFRLYPEKRGAEKIYCFFDEIQTVPGWEAFVDRILRTENCEVYLTGSSAQMLSTEIATQMRGRALSWELYPFSFFEYLDYLGIGGSLPFNTKNRLLAQKAFDGYWETGGFPEVLGVEKSLRIKIHQEYLQSILFRDLIERHDIAHPRAVSDLAYRLMGSVGSPYTLNGLTNQLKSLGHKVPKSTVGDFLRWFEDAYFLFSVRMYHSSFNKSNVNPKKIYAIDHAFIRSITPGILLNSGHLLESLVFIFLRRKFGQVHYYRTQKGYEVDFLIIDQSGRKRLYQVAETIIDPETSDREIRALTAAMEELGLQEGTLITQTEKPPFRVPSGTVYFIEPWRFLLEQESIN